MKVAVTVIAEFSKGMPYDEIDKLVRKNNRPTVWKDATVTYGLVQPPNGARSRRMVEWKSECVDLKDTTSDDVFDAQVRAAAQRGIKLKRTIRNLENDQCPGSLLNQTVFWTWGEGDLIEPPPNF